MEVSKRLALDTNALLDRANEESSAESFSRVFQRYGFSLEVPPTIIAELAYFRVSGNDEEQRLSEIALLWYLKSGA